MKYCLCLCFAITLFACSNNNLLGPNKEISSQYLNTNRLSSQFFEIDINKDTTIFTTMGMQVSILAGALQAATSNVKLEIKEAFTMPQIIAAGLTTVTNGGEMLSSNGMFYINVADGQQAKIVKDISIKTPSSEFNPKAQLYTGERDENGKIKWKDPTSVLQNGSNKNLEIGKTLFSTNCASCHGFEKDQTGPALLHVTKRLPRKWLYDFTRNNAKVRASGDCYANEIFIKWNKTSMPLYPNLENYSDSIQETENTMKLLYDYIDQESNRIAPPQKTDTITYLPDCNLNRERIDSLLQLREDLIKDNGKVAQVQQVQPQDSSTMDNMGEPLKVTPENYDAVNYQFKINAFGWYNIDVLLKDMTGNIDALLQVQIQNTMDADFNIFILVPSKKIFNEGGKLRDEKYYGFHNVNGTTPLPENADCIVFAVGETNGKPVFGRFDFKVSASQTIQLKLQSFDEKDFKTKLAGLDFEGFSSNIQPTKNFKQIKNIDSALEILNKGCNCGAEKAALDLTK